MEMHYLNFCGIGIKYIKGNLQHQWYMLGKSQISHLGTNLNNLKKKKEEEQNEPKLNRRQKQ